MGGLLGRGGGERRSAVARQGEEGAGGEAEAEDDGGGALGEERQDLGDADLADEAREELFGVAGAG
jgi:hypothetical protein